MNIIQRAISRMFGIRSASYAEFLNWSDRTAKRVWNWQNTVTYGYKGNPVVYSALRYNADACSTLDIALTLPGEDGDEQDRVDIEKPTPEQMKLLDLLDRPNRIQSYSEFIQKWSTHLDLSGNAYVRIIGGGTEKVGGRTRTKAVELQLLEPGKVEVEMLPTGELQYKFDDKHILKGDEVIHWRLPNPESDIIGQSPLEAIGYEVDAFTESSKWNYHLLKNQAVPPFVLLIKGLLNLTQTDRDAEAARFKKQNAGARNAGEPIILAGEGAELQQLSQTQKDMDWTGGRAAQKREICAALRCPSILLGDMEQTTYSNYQEARKAHYQETIIPRMRYFIGELNQFLVGRYDENLELELRYDHIEALSDDENDKVDRLAKATWMTVNEKRAAMGLQPIEGEDELNKPPSMGPKEGDDDDTERDPADSDDAGDSGGAGDPAGRTAGKVKKKTRSVDFPQSMYPTLDARAALVDRLDDGRKPWEARYAAGIREYWQAQRDRVVQLFDFTAAGQERAWLTRDYINDFEDELKRRITDKEKWDGIFKPLLQALLIDFGQDVLEELLADGTLFETELIPVQEFIGMNLAQRSQLIDQSTADTLTAILREGIEQGEGVPRLRERIVNTYDEWTRARADMIARTEANLATNKARLLGMQQAGVQFKEWVSARDANVRDTHVEADGQVVGFNEQFSVGSYQADAPGQTGVPGEDINCRCTVAGLYRMSEAI